MTVATLGLVVGIVSVVLGYRKNDHINVALGAYLIGFFFGLRLGFLTVPVAFFSVFFLAFLVAFSYYAVEGSFSPNKYSRQDWVLQAIGLRFTRMVVYSDLSIPHTPNTVTLAKYFSKKGFWIELKYIVDDEMVFYLFDATLLVNRLFWK